MSCGVMALKRARRMRAWGLRDFCMQSITSVCEAIDGWISGQSQSVIRCGEKLAYVCVHHPSLVRTEADVLPLAVAVQPQHQHVRALACVMMWEPTQSISGGVMICPCTADRHVHTRNPQPHPNQTKRQRRRTLAGQMVHDALGGGLLLDGRLEQIRGVHRVPVLVLRGGDT